jgi:predicted Fe-S protein YdhL (DUF1289 family)
MGKERRGFCDADGCEVFGGLQKVGDNYYCAGCFGSAKERYLRSIWEEAGREYEEAIIRAMDAAGRRMEEE